MAKTSIYSIACDFRCEVQQEGGERKEYSFNFEFGPNVDDEAKQSVKTLASMLEKISV